MPSDSFLDTITKDFRRLQAQKARPTGGVEGRVLLNLAFDAGEQWVDYLQKQLVARRLDRNKLHLVFNLLAQRRRKLVGRLSSVGMVFKATPDKKDAQALAAAEAVDRLILALDQKLDQPSRTWEICDWMTLGGVAFEYVPWVPNATTEPMPQFTETGELLFRDVLTRQILPRSQVEALVAQGRPRESFEVWEEVVPTGEVGSEVLGPLQVFVDAAVKDLATLAPDQAVYIAKIRTLGWIEETFGGAVDLEPLRAGSQTLKIVTTTFVQLGEATGGTFLQDLIPLIQGSPGPDDPPMHVVVERYQPPTREFPQGRYTVFVPGLAVLRDGPNPYGEIPLVDFHFTPVTTSFWTKDYVTDLIAPQKFLNKRLSQLGEQANASIYDKLLLGPGLTAKDIPADHPGPIEHAVSEAGVPLVQRLPGPQLPTWFLESINLAAKLLNDIAGGADLFEEQRFPGQLRGPLAVPLLQEILDTEYGPLYQHLGERMARVKQMRLNRVKQFYPPLRTLHYVGRDLRDEVFEFHAEAILRSNVNYQITVERSSLLPELRALREARVRERLQSPLAVLYLDERTGRLDKSKIAADLQFGDLGREAAESQARRLQREIINRLWRGEPVPPVLPFWPHGPMMDELEAEMTTTEFLSASPAIQQAFYRRWQEHLQFLQQRADRQHEALQQQAIQSAVAQAAQQTAAKTAAQVTEEALAQLLESARAGGLRPPVEPPRS